MMLTGIFVLMLLLLSAFFSGSETALTATSKSLMLQKESDGDKRARIVNRLLKRKERLIGTILLGNNLVNILASALATSLMIQSFGEAGIVYATVVMTLLVLIFSEILPKTYALMNSNQLALVVAPIMQPLTYICRPINIVIQGIVRFFLNIFKIKLEHNLNTSQTLSELKGAIELHASQANVKDERAMLKSVLDLADVEVGEIMTHRKNLVTLNADLEPFKIISEIVNSQFTRIPIWRERQDNIVGIIHSKSILRALEPSNNEIKITNILDVTSEPWFIPETTKLLDQLNAFRNRHEHFAIVVDEYGDLQGVVTLEDILEEIVGDIADETDIPIIGVKPQKNGSYLINGSVTIRDLNREFEWNLPDEEASTIAGLIIAESRSIPSPGQKFTFHNFRFEILRKHRNQIIQLRATPPKKIKNEKLIDN